ncbi:MAG: WecB/TagA/CpsF family glycosyltransferase [Candidatus Omnitrophica bacterium]|nr:WecB/TagA/CpsF family glycosyltransferase [Candidatus Omnitrophota bacterium]
MTQKINICGIEIDNISMQEAIESIERLITERKKSFIATVNLDHIVILQKDREFREAYKNAALIVVDSMPLLWAAAFLHTPLKEKISGSDLFPKLCGVAAEKGYRLFFLGGNPGAALEAAEVLKIKYPKIQITGVCSPPYGFEQNEAENKKILAMIQDVKPDILFVGLGAPKQEKWIYKYRNEYQVPVSIGIGASFDFVSGFVKRAPLWMQRVGLEWFWRLLMEPKRLWKRYLIDDMKFFWLLIKQKLS